MSLYSRFVHRTNSGLGNNEVKLYTGYPVGVVFSTRWPSSTSSLYLALNSLSKVVLAIPKLDNMASHPPNKSFEVPGLLCYILYRTAYRNRWVGPSLLSSSPLLPFIHHDQVCLHFPTCSCYTLSIPLRNVRFVAHRDLVPSNALDLLPLTCCHVRTCLSTSYIFPSSTPLLPSRSSRLAAC